MSILPRCFHEAYADLFGYFWLPCPYCGEPFGGHEIGNKQLVTMNHYCLCPDCTKHFIHKYGFSDGKVVAVKLDKTNKDDSNGKMQRL